MLAPDAIDAEGVRSVDPKQVAYEIRRVIRGEFDDCERAIRAGEYDRAINELDDAVTKLKRLADQL
jgi:hypothetical protein